MSAPTLLQLQCFDALVAEGGFAAAAQRLNRTHPTVHTAIRSLEELLGLTLLDRSGYRVTLTPEGAAFHRRVRELLDGYQDLLREAAQLSAGEEPELRVVIGDLCPLPSTLGMLRELFSQHTATRLHLMFEAIGGPWERLRSGACDLAFHHLDRPSPEFDLIELFRVTLIPVAAPGFVKRMPGQALGPQEMRPYTQCIIRDSSLQAEDRGYYLIEGAHTCSVPDQMMKRELILQGLAWGHMPENLVAADLAAGRLESLQSQQLPGATLPHYAIRRRDVAHGPVAQRIWAYLNSAASAAPL